MYNKNIKYESKNISKYYYKNRISWEQYYESERVIIASLNLNSNHSILDVGCGCAGLGLALKTKFGVIDYTGVEINHLAAKTARKLVPHAQIFEEDILDLNGLSINRGGYDFVFSLGCIDWNVEFERMLTAIWRLVKPDGGLVCTFRITVNEGCNEITKSFQYINFDGKLEGEQATYIVLNVNDLKRFLMALKPLHVKAHGYYGMPSNTAVTPYKQLCFAAAVIYKRMPSDVSATTYDLTLPADIKSRWLATS